VGFLSAFYDLFVGLSSFAAGAVANHFGYAAAFGLAAVALVAAGITGRRVFFGAGAADDRFAPPEILSETVQAGRE
jgi:hypothetical protein